MRGAPGEVGIVTAALPMWPETGKCINERKGISHWALQVPPAAGCPLRPGILGIPNFPLGFALYHLSQGHISRDV